MASTASTSSDPFRISKYVPSINLDEESDDDSLGPRQFPPSKKKFSPSDLGLVGKGKKRKRKQQQPPQPSLQEQNYEHAPGPDDEQNLKPSSPERESTVTKPSLSERKRERQNDPDWIEQQGTSEAAKTLLAMLLFSPINSPFASLFAQHKPLSMAKTLVARLGALST